MDTNRTKACGLLLVCGALAGWVRPQLHTSAKPPPTSDQKLDYFEVKINNRPVQLREGQEISVLRGDLVEVVEAKLTSPSLAAAQVDVIGFKSPNKRLGEDRGYVFRTDRLSQWYSEGRQGEVWSILALSGNILHGAAFIRVVDPNLRYAEVRINGKLQVVRPGDDVKVSASDTIKVERVVTNLGDDSKVNVRVLTSSEAGRYQIKFEKDRRTFAVIPLTVTE